MDLEKRVEALEAALEKANLEIIRAQAAVEIQSVMGRYEFYYSAQRQDLIRGLWSKYAPDAAMDIQGGANLINCPRNPKDEEMEHKMMDHQEVGLFRIHTLSTPVVEVAGDGMTARACWFSPGIDTDPGVDEDGNPKGTSKWCWIKYGVDFVREDGQWKLWHVSAYGSFHCDFYQSWADQPEKPLLRSQMPLDPNKPAPPSGDRPGFVPAERNDWTYSINRIPELDPCPPEPYQTWSNLGYPGYRTFDDEEAKKYITW